MSMWKLHFFGKNTLFFGDCLLFIKRNNLFRKSSYFVVKNTCPCYDWFKYRSARNRKEVHLWNLYEFTGND